MPYCFECGTLIQLHDPACPSCGRNFNNEQKSGSGSASQESVTEGFVSRRMADTGNENPAGDDGEWSTSRFLAQESQLGKGTIKPKVVEAGLDGIHFKYDEPPRNFVKAEPRREKMVEFRVTNPEFETDPLPVEPPVLEAEVPVEVTEPGTDIPVTELEDVQPVEAGAPVVEKDTPVPEVEEKDVWVPDDQVQDSIVPVDEVQDPAVDPGVEAEWSDEDWEAVLEPEQPEEDAIPEPLAPEPELRMTPENRRILWEGRQTWFGIPKTKMYRITNYTLMVTDERDHRLFEADLVLITAVKIRQNWFLKLLGMGDLLVWVRDFPDPRFKLEGISEPLKVKAILEDLSGSVV
jgi:hypothetical protein